ncbi:MAG: hypothetical protein KTR27_10860 [Leptolyngbyaceae cyanobacterium MAG.088]|nr:hypothetical protein [Leptolyngbyaceae cyanobacterium MAG.088]
MSNRELRIAKYFTFGISFLLMALGGGVWPFIWWEMYSSGNYTPPKRANRIEFHVQDSDGHEHILRPMDLYTIDDDSSRQAAGYQLTYRAITGTDEQKAIYQPYLIRQIAFVLDTEIQQIEAWQNSWKVDFENHPPLDIEQPVQTVLLDSFNTDVINTVLANE